jgi:erythromycin esterase-like protein
MQASFPIFILAVISLFSCGQVHLKKTIQDNVYKINSISSKDKSDLSSLAKAIGNARVVMLGEQDHGDATTFEAKARIIEYLHEHLGFDVLAFESDFFALNGTWKGVRSSEDLSRLIDGNLFQIWSRCQQFSGLKQYLLDSYQNGKPLQLSGFDVQLHGRYSQVHFSKWFVNFLRERKLLDVTEKEPNANFVQVLDSIVYHSKQQTSLSDTSSLKRFQSQLVQIETELIRQGLSEEYEMQVLKSLQSQVFMMLCRNGDNIRKGAQERDRQMADNLHWLMSHQFAERKVIVWAASSHIYGAPFEPVRHYFSERYYPMGYCFKKMATAFPVYTLGFTSYAGSTQRIGGSFYLFESNEPNSLEEWVHESKADYAFIDLDKAKTSLDGRHPFSMAGAGHFQIKQYWMDGFNGVFYVKKMEPCKAIQ